jgi:cysteine desulfuration protein SufE
MMNVENSAAQIVREFSLFDDWMDKYNYLIEMGKSLPLIDEKYKTDQYLISGCQSRVWVSAEWVDGKVVFKADSDAVITKGIVNLLIRVFSNQTPEDIIDADLSFIDEIGLKEHLSPTRSNGLVSMIKQMKLYAVVFKTKMKEQGA